MRTKRRLIATLVGLALAMGVGAAEGRPCRKLCRELIHVNIVETCSTYRGRVKRACKKDVRQTILGICKREPGSDCLGAFGE